MLGKNTLDFVVSSKTSGFSHSTILGSDANQRMHFMEQKTLFLSIGLLILLFKIGCNHLQSSDHNNLPFLFRHQFLKYEKRKNKINKPFARRATIQKHQPFYGTGLKNVFYDGMYRTYESLRHYDENKGVKANIRRWYRSDVRQTLLKHQEWDVIVSTVSMPQLATLKKKATFQNYL